MMNRRPPSSLRRRVSCVGGSFLAVVFILFLFPVHGHADDRSAPANYTVDSHDSEVQIYVYRSGWLAFAGHDHIVSTSIIDGKLSYTPSPALAADFSLSIPVDALVVDDPALRKAAGGRFSAQVSDEDRAGTRRNMLSDKVLAAARFPRITVEGHWLQGTPLHGTVAVTLVVRNTRRDYRVPVDVRADHDHLLVTGVFHPKQTELGIKPLSIFAEAVKVADSMDIRFRLVFVPIAGAVQPGSR